MMSGDKVSTVGNEGTPDFTLNILDGTSNKLIKCHVSVEYE